MVPVRVLALMLRVCLNLYKIPPGSITHYFIIAGEAKGKFFMSRLGKSIFWKGNARKDFSGQQRI